MKQQNVRKRITRQYRDAGFEGKQAVKMADPLVELHENMVTKDDLKAELAATRADFDAKLAEAIAPLATKAELAEAIAPLATKAELAEAIAPLATKAELAEAIKPLATRAEMKVGFAELRTEMADLRGEVLAEISKLESRLMRWFFAVLVGGIVAATGLLRLLEYLF